MRRMTELAMALALAGLLGLWPAACGGGGGGDKDATADTAVPDADVAADLAPDLLPDEEEEVPLPCIVDCVDGDGQEVPADVAADVTSDVTADVAADAADAVETGDALPQPLPLLAAAEGVRVIDDKVWVANANAAWDNEQGKMVYKTGFISVFAAADLKPVKQIETPWLNPQYVLPVGSEVAVICSGTSVADESWTFTPDSPGGVAFYDPATLEQTGKVEIPAGQPVPLAGFPGSASYSEAAGLLFVGSGTAAVVFVVDVAARALKDPLVVPTAGAGNDIIVVVAVEGYVLAISFNDGIAYKLDPAQQVPGTVTYEVAETGPGEGPVDALLLDGKVYVVLTLSSKVAALDLATGKAEYPWTTGAAANRVAAQDGMLFIVNSMDNNLTRIDLATKDATPGFASFDPGTNPWEIGTSNKLGFVTGYLSNALYKVDLETGDVLATAQ